VAYQFNQAWFERNGELNFDDLVKISERINEFKLYEDELPGHPHVLDVGVGLGYETAYYLQRGASVDALDMDARVLELLAKNCSRYSDRLTTLHYHIPFENPNALWAKYDLIIVSNILHYMHYEEIGHCLSQLAGLLSSNGFILIRSHSKQHPYNDPKHIKKETYQYFFSLQDIAGFFSPAEFQVIYNADYYRTYNRLECRIFGYDYKKGPFKYSITSILKKVT